MAETFIHKMFRRTIIETNKLLNVEQILKVKENMLI